MPDYLTETVLAEYQALTARAGIVDVGARTQIEILGADRITFLHSFCTNDIKKLEPGQGCEAFLCNAKGKVIAYVQVYCRRDSLVLETSPGQSGEIVAHLDRYVIREDVRLADRQPEWSQFLLAGPLASAVLARAMPHAPASVIETRSDWLAHADVEIAGVPISLRQARLTGPPSFLLSYPRDDAVPAQSARVRDRLVESGAQSCSLAALEIVRIEAAIPSFGQDITDDNLPQEVGRDVHAISFTKGCYLGQETVARIDAMGHVNRKLCQFLIEGDALPATGSELLADGKAVGWVTSCTFSPRHGSFLALGYVRTTHAASGTNLTSGHDGPRAIVV